MSARADEVALVALRESFERVVADRDEHPEAWLAVDLGLAHQTVLHQGAEHIEKIAAELVTRAANLFDLGKHHAVDKDSKPRAETALGRVQEIPAPGDRAAQGALPLREISRG